MDLKAVGQIGRAFAHEIKNMVSPRKTELIGRFEYEPGCLEKSIKAHYGSTLSSFQSEHLFTPDDLRHFIDKHSGDEWDERKVDISGQLSSLMDGFGSISAVDNSHYVQKIDLDVAFAKQFLPAFESAITDVNNADCTEENNCN